MNEIAIHVPDGHTPIAVYDSHGQIRGRITLAVPAGPAEWDAEMCRSRAAVQAVRWFRGALTEWQRESERADGVGTSTKERRVAFAAGLEDGLRGIAVALHPEIGAAPTPPNYDGPGKQAHRCGWELGWAMRRAVEFVDREERP